MKNSKLFLILIIIVFLSFAILVTIKSKSYFSAKNDCLNNNTLSFQIFFEPETNHSEIDKYIKNLNNISGVLNVQYISQDEALDNFADRHKDDSQILDSLNELNFNPLSSILTIKIKHTNLEDYSKTKQKIIYLANKQNLTIEKEQDINITYLQEELNKVKKASFLKDFPLFFFNNNKNFFADKYSPVCATKK